MNICFGIWHTKSKAGLSNPPSKENLSSYLNGLRYIDIIIHDLTNSINFKYL